MPESSDNAEVMHIKTKAEWEAILAQGAEVLDEGKRYKIFRMPDGKIWRVMPQYRMAWPVTVIARVRKPEAGKTPEVDIKELI